MNVLKPNLKITIETLLEKGLSQREIRRKTGIHRKTVRRYSQQAVHGELLRSVPGGLAAWGLDQVHAPGERRHLRPIRFNTQSAERSHGEQRDLQRGGGPPRDRGQPDCRV